MPVQQQSQYVQSDKDCNPVSPQPPDVEITDIYGNVFDNFNKYGTDAKEVQFTDKDNVDKDPQPGYQNLDYRQYTFENVIVNPQPLPDAGDYVFSGLIPGTTRTPSPYVKPPLFPDGIPEWYVETVGIPTIEVVLTEEGSEALIVAENDVNEIELVGVNGLPQVQAYIAEAS
tara:strand:+ start:493 stop:1008 length:516 start_codon:yes stop_codon:yes gene_type:complete